MNVRDCEASALDGLAEYIKKMTITYSLTSIHISPFDPLLVSPWTKVHHHPHYQRTGFKWKRLLVKHIMTSGPKPK